MTDSEVPVRTALGVGTGVSLSESRGGAVGQGVETGRGGNVTIARGERVVGGVEVAKYQRTLGREEEVRRNVPESHDELTSHDIQLVLALQFGSVGSILGGTDSETVLVVRDLNR